MITFESPTFAIKIYRSKQITTKQVDPENAISTPENSNSRLTAVNI